MTGTLDDVGHDSENDYRRKVTCVRVGIRVVALGNVDNAVCNVSDGGKDALLDFASQNHVSLSLNV